ncbi:MAG: Rne/Rng family ribonuclease [Bacteroidota bacterium]
MDTELVINANTEEIEIALLEDKQLTELNSEQRDLKYTVGDIYLGKVKRIMPGLNAAFVDVGYQKDAFLHYLDLGPQFQSLNKYVKSAISRKGKSMPLSRMKLEPDIDKNGKIGNVLSTGQQVLVQIAKEPISTKGPRLGSEISIAGRYLVLMPFSDKISVSQKLSSLEEKKRLKSLVKSIKPKNYGVIIRTVAEGKKVAELDAELRSLVRKWESTYQRLGGMKAPKVVLSELNRTSAMLRDVFNVSFNAIHINDDSLYREIRDYMSSIAPEKEKIVKFYDKGQPIFDFYGVTKQVKTLFGKTVSFKNGAYLIIEHTEALHVIDVNSGNRSKLGIDQESNALEVNLAAAEEIARQLRLRDMGGIIVVDFIDMNLAENKQKVFDKMKSAMNNDRTKHSILPLTKFGLMQITRQRVRPELHIKTLEKCPTCQGTGEITPSILFVDNIQNTLATYLKGNSLRKITLKVHPYIAGYIKKGFFSKRLKWMLKYRCWINVKPMVSYDFLEYKFFDNQGEIIDYL